MGTNTSQIQVNNMNYEIIISGEMKVCVKPR